MLRKALQIEEAHKGVSSGLSSAQHKVESDEGGRIAWLAEKGVEIVDNREEVLRRLDELRKNFQEMNIHKGNSLFLFDKRKVKDFDTEALLGPCGKVRSRA